ncbi:hypothetical protein DL96DRAFT_1550089 [Flagelloscypha sp. PMI_526]|nr:hypothetical protein DL96DRAFT_1550089 [Flagelloscypha sp. PMI_526]
MTLLPSTLPPPPLTRELFVLTKWVWDNIHLTDEWSEKKSKYRRLILLVSVFEYALLERHIFEYDPETAGLYIPFAQQTGEHDMTRINMLFALSGVCRRWRHILNASGYLCQDLTIGPRGKVVNLIHSLDPRAQLARDLCFLFSETVAGGINSLGELVGNCPNLEYLFIGGVRGVGESTLQRHAISLPKLRVLRLNVINAYVLHAILRWDLPSLETLVLDSPEVGIPTASSFCSRSLMGSLGPPVG